MESNIGKVLPLEVRISFLIRLLRHAYNLNQTYVAYKLGISLNSYAKIESGTTPVKKELLTKLACLYEIEHDSLSCGNAAAIMLAVLEKQGFIAKCPIQERLDILRKGIAESLEILRQI